MSEFRWLAKENGVFESRILHASNRKMIRPKARNLFEVCTTLEGSLNQFLCGVGNNDFIFVVAVKVSEEKQGALGSVVRRNFADDMGCAALIDGMVKRNVVVT